MQNTAVADSCEADLLLVIWPDALKVAAPLTYMCLFHRPSLRRRSGQILCPANMTCWCFTLTSAGSCKADSCMLLQA